MCAAINTYQPRAMLVTGGCGFIGANFIRHVLTQTPHTQIINLDKLTYAGSLVNIKDLPNAKQHHFIQGDISDSTLVKHIFAHHHIDTVVHFAAESHVDRSISGPAEFMQTNILGTFVLLEAARQHWLMTEHLKPSQCRFHHISTDEVFGSLQTTDAAFTEKTAYNPRSPYSASKAAADHLVNAYYHTYGLPITLSNCSNNFGPHQHTEKFIPTIIRACLANENIPIYGHGNNIRDWLYVEDHCRAILQIIQHGRSGDSYAIGGDNEWKNIDLAHYLCQQLDKIKPNNTSYQSLITYVPDRQGHDFRYAINSSKLKTELHWETQEPFASAIEKTIAFYTR